MGQTTFVSSNFKQSEPKAIKRNLAPINFRIISPTQLSPDKDDHNKERVNSHWISCDYNPRNAKYKHMEGIDRERKKDPISIFFNYDLTQVKKAVPIIIHDSSGLPKVNRLIFKSINF